MFKVQHRLNDHLSQGKEFTGINFQPVNSFFVWGLGPRIHWAKFQKKRNLLTLLFSLQFIQNFLYRTLLISIKINMYGWPFHISTFIFCSVWTWYGFFSLYLHEEKNALFYPFLAHWAVGAFNGNRPLDGCRRLVFYLLQMAFRCKCGQRITRPHTFLRKQQPTPSELQQNE